MESIQEYILYAPAASAVFALTALFSVVGFQQPQFRSGWMLRPYLVMQEGTYYTLLTSGFVHADFAHLGFNLLSFYFFAFQLELIVGSGAFLIIYLGSLILSDIPTLLKEQGNPGYASLGASGAISGVLFSFILYVPEARLGVFLIPVAIPAPIFAVMYVAYSYYASRANYDNVNHEAHLWGAVAGLALTLLLDFTAGEEFIRKVLNF